MTTDLELPVLRDFAIALLIGALVGVEREKRKEAHHARGTPGIRTFMLLALTGALAAWMSEQLRTPWVLVVAMAGVSAAIVAGYLVETRVNPEALGLTTEMASLAVCLLGAMAVMGQAGLAVVLGIAVSALLAYKQPLHGLVQKLGTDDLYAGLKLLIATFIILPILPNRAVDPWGAINPYKLWWLVILISSLSLVGYVASRWLGPDRGLALTGLTGGLVSSTAVTLSFARRSRESDVPAAAPSGLAVGILLAWGVMCLRVIVMVAVLNRDLLASVAVPFTGLALVTLLAAALIYRRRDPGAPAATPTAPVPLKNPFSLTSAIQFAVLFAVVLLFVKLVQHYFPGRGVYLVATVAGLTDVDAITLSMTELGRDPAQLRVAARAIVLAALSNTLVKGGLVVGLANPALRSRIGAATLAILAAGVVALLFL